MKHNPSVRRTSSTNRRRARRGRRPEAPRGAIRLQPLYPLGELVLASGLTRGALCRLLAGVGIELVRAGRFVFVPLAELEDKLRTLVDSIKLVERLSELESTE